MQRQDWTGVFTAVTTPFRDDLTVDHAFLHEHVSWMLEHGVRGIVPLGSLGEGATLSHAEKLEVLATCRKATAGRVPLVAGIGTLSTRDAEALARDAAGIGCDGLMVLPPYVYRGDARETLAHLSAVIDATPLSCMLYNNPIAYGTDVTPAQLGELARHGNLHAVKESSGDIRRVTEIVERHGDRFRVFVGMDDVIVEGIAAGAVGWIAGLVNALPAESVRLFELATAGRRDEARALYEWFLPLLRLDTVPKFVQLIKLVQQEIGKGSERVRAPRLEITGAERDAAIALIRDHLGKIPSARA
ncbi:MAG TPA: dihydrodipicolinate synthase family protein [Gemmatimonadaceae bacterium]|nr:dihydrodipicolinate synthase family protein [Gemmatimonadaceae bacterium]